MTRSQFTAAVLNASIAGCTCAVGSVAANRMVMVNPGPVALRTVVSGTVVIAGDVTGLVVVLATAGGGGPDGSGVQATASMTGAVAAMSAARTVSRRRSGMCRVSTLRRRGLSSAHDEGPFDPGVRVCRLSGLSC